MSSPLPWVWPPAVEIELVRMPAGSFARGGADVEEMTFNDEWQQQQTYLDEFLIGKHEVTGDQFRAFVQAADYKTTAERGLDLSSDRGKVGES